MRGAWLVLIVRLGWTFSLRFNHLVLQVIFAIGAAMMALAVLVHLPRWAIAAAGIAIIAGHNMFDGVKAGQFGAAAPIWNVLHQPRSLYGAAGELDSRCSYKAAHTLAGSSTHFPVTPQPGRSRLPPRPLAWLRRERGRPWPRRNEPPA